MTNRSKKVSLGFQVVNTMTGEALSAVFSTRLPAREIVASIYATTPAATVGIRKLEEYVAR